MHRGSPNVTLETWAVGLLLFGGLERSFDQHFKAGIIGLIRLVETLQVGLDSGTRTSDMLALDAN